MISVIVIALNRCYNNFEEIKELESPHLNLRVIPEDTLGGYVLQWEDEINPTGADKNKKLRMRPYELYCTVTSQTNDTLGYYIGSSSPRQYLDFVLSDLGEKKINLEFQIGINHFSKILESMDDREIEKFNKMASSFPRYEVLTLDLNTQIYKWVSVKLYKDSNR